MSSEHEVSSQRPYLLRAMHEWMADNHLTPHIVVDASADGLRAPAGLDGDGKLILNISYAATRSLSLGNDVICFEARFSGVPHQVRVPIAAVLGIYARENGQGMAFVPDDTPPGGGPDTGGPDGTRRHREVAKKPESAKPARPALKVVK